MSAAGLVRRAAHRRRLQLQGSIQEYEGLISEQRILLYASVDGEREGSRVAFLKTYEGVLNGNATEIAGQWHIAGTTGRFIMPRASAVEEAEVRKGVEPVSVA